MERKEKMKKKKSALRLFLVMISACLLLLVTVVGVTACDSDENVPNKINPQERILGKWKEMRQGNIDMRQNDMILNFRSDGKVVFSYMSYDANGQAKQSEKESAYTFEDDWHYNGDGKVMKGHLSFLMYEELGYKVADRFLVLLDGDQLVLLPDMGIVYVVDPTMYFERFK